MTLRRFSRALLVVLSASVAPAAAQDAPDPAGDEAQPSPENIQATQRAREHFQQGARHFDDHEYREAIRQFELAAQIIPSADLWFNIARAHEELSEFERAIEHYQRYLRDRVDPPDRERVEQRIESLRERAASQRQAGRASPTTGTLRVSASADGAAIAIDREPIGTAPVDLPLSLGPGHHRLDVDLDGYIPFRSEVGVEAGVTTAAYADLVPETRYRSIRGRRVFTWIAAGLAGAALVGSLAVGITARQLQNDDDLEGARDRAAISDYLLGAGIGLGVVSVILYFIEGRAVGTERVPPPSPPGDDVASAGAEAPMAF